MAQPKVIQRLIDDFSSRRPMRTTSLIISLFGDVVSQHGGTVWLSSLAKAMAPLGVNERLVRTSVFRLTQEGWLESERVGRRSYYRFSAYGKHEYERAAKRIYAMENATWNGRWQLLIPQDIPEDKREPLKRSLYWQGYRNIISGAYAKPGGGSSAMLETLEEFGVADRVILLDAESASISPAQPLRKLVQNCWHLDEVAMRYRDFQNRYKPLLKWLQNHSASPEDAFTCRTLLIHDHRRILLQDTPLPETLLPPAWPGSEAMALTSSIYKSLADASVSYITAAMESGNGSMPPPLEGFYQRFSGLARD